MVIWWRYTHVLSMLDQWYAKASSWVLSSCWVTEVSTWCKTVLKHLRIKTDHRPHSGFWPRRFAPDLNRVGTGHRHRFSIVSQSRWTIFLILAKPRGPELGGVGGKLNKVCGFAPVAALCIMLHCGLAEKKTRREEKNKTATEQTIREFGVSVFTGRSRRSSHDRIILSLTIKQD